jgi:hypothetical protein
VDEREGYGGEKRGFSPPEKRRLEVMKNENGRERW